MTRATKHPRRMALPAAALAALLLAGCSSGHVGESWQCPLADAGTCDSVAAADPAVPDMDAARHTVLGEPLWRVRGGENGAVSPKNDAPCDAACDGEFDPFAWLARLFAPETADREKTAATGPVRLLPTEAAIPSAVPAEPVPLPAEPGTRELHAGGEDQAGAALPGEPDAPKIHPVAEESHGAGLRTDEVVARIWIAPFVDAGGVYREASWVRVVLEPAGWRLGR